MVPTTEISSDVKKPGEPHRIYWQQWIVGNNGSSATTTTTTTSDGTTTAVGSPQEERLSRRELITSSAAVRVSRSAKASDLTELLRKSLLLPERQPNVGGTFEFSTSPHDSLVLVGTLYSLPRNYIQFEHEPMGNQSDRSCSDDAFHVVRTLHPTDSPLVARDAMELYLSRYLERSEAIMAANATQQSHDGADALNTNMMLPAKLPPNDLPSSSTHSAGSNSSSHHSAPRSISTANIAPKLQWYYIPACVHALQNTTAPQAMIPNCVELDGYSTAMEEEDDEKGDDDDKNATSDDDDNDDNTSTTQSRSEAGFGHLPFEESTYQTMVREFPWLSPSKETAPSQGSHLNECTDKMSRRLQRENRRLVEYSTQSSSSDNKITGYLLKQDMRDPNVWRRMYCTLAHNEFWFVSRIYTETSSSTPPSKSDNTEAGESTTGQESNGTRYSKHRRITLTRALLVEPTAGYAPLFRTPYAFEIVSSRGTPHVFRANCRQVQRMWITALSDRIVQSYESSLMQHAELIVIDQCLARSRRTNASAVTPLWAEAVRVSDSNHQQFGLSPSESRKKKLALSPTKPSIGNSIGSVLRWGLDVALYRDKCRYIGSSMPAKAPVLVATPPRRRFFTSTRYRNGSAGSSSEVGIPTEPTDSFDPVTRQMILATWDHASALLARATSLALTLQVRSSIKQYNDTDGISSSEPVKLSNGIDTLCRHIEFVITGKSILSKGSFHNSSTSLGKDSGPGDLESDVHITSQNRQPPADLFDHLLGELQSLAALADRRVHHRELSDRYPPNFKEEDRADVAIGAS